MISYPLREYISSKKDDDYGQAFSSRNSSSVKIKKSSETKSSYRFVYLIVFIILLLIISLLYSFYSYIDPTCFNNECTDFVCEAYSEGLIGGHLCPDLCTTKNVQLLNCLGDHKDFRSRLFEDNEDHQVIRCYLKHPLSKANPSGDIKQHFHFPEDGSTFDTLYLAIQQHIQKTLILNNPEELIENLLQFADFNKDGKISLSEARSIWSLVQIDEFLYTILLSDKGYTPKILGTCGHLFAMEKVLYPNLPVKDQHELFPPSERPNWYQRVRLAIGIVEFYDDLLHFQDTDQHLYLCQPLYKSFGYDKDYEAKILKLNHLTSSKSMLNRLPNDCNSDRDCLYDLYCDGICNKTTNKCQMKEFHFDSLNELCLLISTLIISDGNSTFLESYNPLLGECQDIVNSGKLSKSVNDLNFLEIRRTIFLQNLKNLLWSNVEYQMSKITKKSTKKTAQSPVQSSKLN